MNGVNDAPVCQPVSITTNENTADSTAPDCNDPDVEPLAYTVTQPTQGRRERGRRRSHVRSRRRLRRARQRRDRTRPTATSPTPRTTERSNSNDASVAGHRERRERRPGVPRPVHTDHEPGHLGSRGRDCTDVDDPVAAHDHRHAADKGDRERPRRRILASTRTASTRGSTAASRTRRTATSPTAPTTGTPSLRRRTSPSP